MAFDLTQLRRRIEKWRGATIEWDLTAERSILAEIAGRESATHRAADEELQALSRNLQTRARAGESAADRIVEAYALVREAARRVLGQRPFDVQVLGAVAMQRGTVVEMQTGEGKTLAAVMPVYLHALAGRGAHVLTFNDYLARRDAAWMGPVYRFLGLEVGSVQEGSTLAERQRAYAADVTYVTAKQAGFDLLRDHRVLRREDLVHRPFHFALVDEADSLLIDEARVPLVLAGHVPPVASAALRAAELVRTLSPGVEFATDEYERNVWLTDAGLDRAEVELGCGSLLAAENRNLHAELNCALHAAVLLHRDVDYIVRDGDVQHVDEFTGRVVADRQWPDGRVLGSITLQHFLRSYPQLCGMTGTAQDSAEELRQFYGLDVVVVPTNRPMIRADRPDVVFTHREAKERAVVEEIARAQRIIEGQNFDIRKELWRYSMQLDDQRRAVQRDYRNLLLGHKTPDLLATADPERYAELVDAVGEVAVREAERQATLHFISAYWSEHLATIADIREGIHNVRAGGRDPFIEFQNESHDAFEGLWLEIEMAVLRTLRTVRVTGEGIDLAGAGIRVPSSTWTYLVNDDPARGPLGALLTGPGTAGFAVGAALYAGWILIPWGIYVAWRNRRRRKGR